MVAVSGKVYATAREEYSDHRDRVVAHPLEVRDHNRR
jgi:hypothetical protein